MPGAGDDVRQVLRVALQAEALVVPPPQELPHLQPWQELLAQRRGQGPRDPSGLREPPTAAGVPPPRGLRQRGGPLKRAAEHNERAAKSDPPPKPPITLLRARPLLSD